MELIPKASSAFLLPGALLTFISETLWLQTGSAPLPLWLLGLARKHTTVIGWTVGLGAVDAFLGLCILTFGLSTFEVLVTAVLSDCHQGCGGSISSFGFSCRC